MKLKTEQEINTLSKKSWDEWKSEDDFELDGGYYEDGYANGYSRAQQDLLASASEGFEEKFGEEPKDGDSWDWANRKVGWQAATLANEKKHQEELKHKQSVINNLESIRESQLARIEELEKTVASQEKDAEIENLKKLLDSTNDIRKIEFETFLNLKKENEELKVKLGKLSNSSKEGVK